MTPAARKQLADKGIKDGFWIFSKKPQGIQCERKTIGIRKMNAIIVRNSIAVDI
jgi:hypothetical protein